MLGALDTTRAIVPVWAVQALMAHTIDELIATITDSGMADISSRVAEEVSQGRKSCVRGSRCECMAGMVAVLVADMAIHAQIVVFARKAGDKVLLGEAVDAAVAGSGWLLITDY